MVDFSAILVQICRGLILDTNMIFGKGVFDLFNNRNQKKFYNKHAVARLY